MRNYLYMVTFFCVLLISNKESYGFSPIQPEKLVHIEILSEKLSKLASDNYGKVYDRILFAKRGGKKGAKNKKGKAKILSSEGQIRRTGDKTSIDFDSVDILGSRKTPLGSVINQNRVDMGYDFVKIRLRWHPEMIKSASSLDTE